MDFQDDVVMRVHDSMEFVSKVLLPRELYAASLGCLGCLGCARIRAPAPFSPF
jgi:hypothetical protein